MSIRYIYLHRSRYGHRTVLTPQGYGLADRFENLMQNGIDAIIIAGEDLGIVDANASAQEMYGYGRDELIGMDLMDLTAPDKKDSIETVMYLVGENRLDRLETMHVKKDGTLFPVEISISAMEISGKKLLLGVVRDLTGHGGSSEVSCCSDRQLRLIADAGPTLLSYIDADCRYLWVNKTYERWFGRTTQEVQGLEMRAVLGEEAWYKILPYVRRTLAGETVTYEQELLLKKVGSRWLHVTYTPDWTESGDVLGFVVHGMDITEHKESEEALRISEARFRTLFEQSPLSIQILDPEGRTLEVNNAWKKLWGLTYDMLTDYNILQDSQLIESGSMASIKKGFAGEITELPTIRYDPARIGLPGRPRWVRALIYPVKNESGRIVQVVLMHMDITDLVEAEAALRKAKDNLETLVEDRTRELEERNVTLREEIEEHKKTEEEKSKVEMQLIQSQKIDALGRFAGGIAHDLNNILYPIIINTEMILEGTEPGTEIHEILEQVLNAAYRQRDLIKQILSFSRRSEQKRIPIAVTPLIKETIAFLRSSLPSTIEIRTHMNARNDVIMGDPVQIQQVVMNLCRNAADELESQNGTIEVSLESAWVESLPAHPEVRPGDYLILKVKDTGRGMTPDVLEKIFEPFFTTKEVGKGSGMGLAIVHGIVKNHGGIVTVESEPGKGSLFAVYLPSFPSKTENPA